jgi:hypothetical protein
MLIACFFLLKVNIKYKDLDVRILITQKNTNIFFWNGDNFSRSWPVGSQCRFPALGMPVPTQLHGIVGLAFNPV